MSGKRCVGERRLSSLTNEVKQLSLMRYELSDHRPNSQVSYFSRYRMSPESASMHNTAPA